MRRKRRVRETLSSSSAVLERSTSTTLAPADRTSAFVNFCLPIDAEHRLDARSDGRR